LTSQAQKQFNVGDYLRILIKGMWIVCICVAVVVGYAVYQNLTTPPVYEASALILIKKEGGVQKAIFDNEGFMDTEKPIHNHMEILKSRTLAKEVIHRLQQIPEADSLIFLGNRPSIERFSFKRWITTTFRASGGVPADTWQRPTFERLVETFRRSCTTSIPKDQTEMIELKVRASDPYEAALLANTWMEAYQAMDVRESKGEISEVRSFLETKLEEVQHTLSQSEDALKEYKQSEGVTELNAETQQMIAQQAGFEAQYQTAVTELEANGRRLSYLKSQLDDNQRAMVDQASGLSTEAIQGLERQMAELIANKAAYEQQLKGAGYATATDVKLRQMDQRLKGLQQSIAEERRKSAASGGSPMDPLNLAESLFETILQIETENKSLRAKADAYAEIVQRYNASLNTLPGKSLKLARFQREAEVNNNIFMMLREKYEESRISEASQAGAIRIVDYAEPPKVPIKPDKARNLANGVFGGLGLGIAILFLREYLDRSVKTIEDVERLGFPVLGSIPTITSRRTARHPKRTVDRTGLIESRLITHFLPNSPVSESYRTLRTNIQFSRVDRPIKSLLVTSPGPSEGKSTSATNLAITFAQMGAKTLLIDADLRRPVLHNLFGCKRNEGLTHVLIGKLPLRDVVRRTRIKNLYLLTAGTVPKNPSEFLASKIMQRLLRKLTAQFDLVILDSPPVIAVTDSAVLASSLDAVLLVVRSEQTDRDAFLRTITLLKNVNARLIGVMVNGLDLHHRYGSYYKYYTYS
jgi:capsular exopolysaccharide synthesis family protein